MARKNSVRLVMAIALAAPVGVASTAAAEQPAAGWLECVPFARDVSGIRIFGNALTWWDQAKAHYARGSLPRAGAVMAFQPFGRMTLGHVAVVRRVVSGREVRLDHANWSLINGRRGQIERDVRAVDVSPANDWSQVRVWFAPIAGLGGTQWPLHGFIYPDRPMPGTRAFRLELPFDLVRMEVPRPRAALSVEVPRARVASGMARIGRLLGR